MDVYFLLPLHPSRLIEENVMTFWHLGPVIVDCCLLQRSAVTDFTLAWLLVAMCDCSTLQHPETLIKLMIMIVIMNKWISTDYPSAQSYPNLHRLLKYISCTLWTDCTVSTISFIIYCLRSEADRPDLLCPPNIVHPLVGQWQRWKWMWHDGKKLRRRFAVWYIFKDNWWQFCSTLHIVQHLQYRQFVHYNTII